MASRWAPERRGEKKSLQCSHRATQSPSIKPANKQESRNFPFPFARCSRLAGCQLTAELPPAGWSCPLPPSASPSTSPSRSRFISGSRGPSRAVLIVSAGCGTSSSETRGCNRPCLRLLCQNSHKQRQPLLPQAASRDGIEIESHLGLNLVQPGSLILSWPRGYLVTALAVAPIESPPPSLPHLNVG